MDPALAAGSGIVVVLINSLSGVFGYAKQKRIHYRTGMILGIGALPGSVLGVWLLQIYSSRYFYIVFATLLVALGMFLFAKNSPFAFKKKKGVLAVSGEGGMDVAVLSSGSTPTDSQPIALHRLVPLGMVMGLLSSYLGIGGGWLLVPILVYLYKVPTHYATATSIFSLTIYSSVGVISQMFYSSIDWVTVLWGGVGVILGSQVGVYVSRRIPGKMIFQMLSVLLMVIGIRMYFS